MATTARTGRTPGRAPLAGLLGLCLLLSCSTDPAAKYSVNFNEDSVQAYVQCTTNVLYCTAWQKSSRSFVAALDIRTSTASMTTEHDGNWNFQVTSLGGGKDSLTSLDNGVSCGGFWLTISANGGVISGNYLEDFDCHGRSGAGHLAGQQ